jgi:hypothetical protein
MDLLAIVPNPQSVDSVYEGSLFAVKVGPGFVEGLAPPVFCREESQECECNMDKPVRRNDQLDYLDAEHHEVIGQTTLADFFEIREAFSQSVRDGYMELTDFAFMTFAGNLELRQFVKLRQFLKDEPSDANLQKFLSGVVMTPYVFLAFSEQVSGLCEEAGTHELGIATATWMLNQFSSMKITLNEEILPLKQGLRNLTFALHDTELEHVFAEAFFEQTFHVTRRAEIAIFTYAMIADTNELPFGAAYLYNANKSASLVAGSAHQWLARNEARVVDFFNKGDLIHDFNSELADVIDKLGLSTLSRIIRLRQFHYATTELLKNQVDHQVVPDEQCVELLMEKQERQGIKSKTDSDAALLAYELVNGMDKLDEDWIIDHKRCSAIFRAAIKAVASLNLSPHPTCANFITGMVNLTIQTASSFDQVKWLEEVDFLAPLAKQSGRYKGMHLESAIGL